MILNTIFGVRNPSDFIVAAILKGKEEYKDRMMNFLTYIKIVKNND